MATPYATYGPQDWRSGSGTGGAAGSHARPWRLPLAGRPLWIALTILAFIAWWPIGLAALFYLVGSGRMGCRGYGRRHGAERWSGPWSNWRSFCADETSAPSSGNRAFDEYRADTLRRLEDEQREFTAFLDRLRVAKDKAEFDAFMAERRRPSEPPAEPAPG